MQNEDKWVPTKFVEKNGAWSSSRSHVSPASWFFADLIAAAYSHAIGRHARGRLIDVGCGSAPLYAMYKGRSSSITCIDWQGSLHNISFCDQYVDLNKAWDGVQSNAFDTVIATDVLEHLHSPENFFSEVARICAPGGKLILGVPFLYCIHEAPHDHLRHTEYSLRRYCELNSLEVIELSATGGTPEVILDLTFKTLGSRRTISKALYFLARGLLRCPPIPRLSRKTRQAFPLSYVLVAAKPAG